MCIRDRSHNLALIQIADVTGTYGISFLIIAVNVLIKENLSFVFSSSTQERVSLIRTNMAVVGILLAVYAYGFWRLAESPQLPSMRVAVVPVSYTHLDVYKRQVCTRRSKPRKASRLNARTRRWRRSRSRIISVCFRS